MSVQAIGWVLDNSPTKGSDRLVLISIANHARKADDGDAWEAYPGIDTIQREAGLDRRRTVVDALTRLVDKGAIERIVNAAPDNRIPAHRRPNLYRIITTGVSDNGTPSPGDGGVGMRLEGVSDNGEMGCRKTAPKPLEEPSENRTTSGPAGKPAKARGYTDEAHELAVAEWERRGDTKPVCGFVAFRARISEALAAGHPRDAVASALPTMSVFSRNSFDLALARRVPSNGRRVDDDRDAPSGRVTL